MKSKNLNSVSKVLKSSTPICFVSYIFSRLSIEGACRLYHDLLSLILFFIRLIEGARRLYHDLLVSYIFSRLSIEGARRLYHDLLSLNLHSILLMALYFHH